MSLLLALRFTEHVASCPQVESAPLLAPHHRPPPAQHVIASRGETPTNPKAQPDEVTKMEIWGKGNGGVGERGEGPSVPRPWGIRVLLVVVRSRTCPRDFPSPLLQNKLRTLLHSTPYLARSYMQHCSGTASGRSRCSSRRRANRLGGLSPGPNHFDSTLVKGGSRNGATPNSTRRSAGQPSFDRYRFLSALLLLCTFATYPPLQASSALSCPV